MMLGAMLGAMPQKVLGNARTNERTDVLTNAVKTHREIVKFLTVRVGLWISRIHLNERAVK